MRCRGSSSDLHCSDQPFDLIVYVLYGLTEEEMAVVEGKSE